MRKFQFLIVVIALLAITTVLPTEARSPSTPATVKIRLSGETFPFKLITHPEGTFVTFDTTLPRVGEAGAPALPVLSRLVGIPASKSPAVQVTYGDPVEGARIEGTLEPVPEYRPVIEPESGNWLGERLEPVYRPDRALYDADRWYPEEPLRVSEPMTLRGQPVVRVEFTPVQVNLATGETRWLPYADVTLSWPESGAATGEPVADPHFESTRATTVSNHEEARDWRLPRETPPALRRSGTAPRWIITLQGEGLFGIPYEDLVAAGVPVSQPGRLALYYGSGETAVEQAIWLYDSAGDGFGPGDYLYLVNSREHGRWSRNVVYHLTVTGEGTGLRMPTRSVLPAFPSTATSVPYHLRVEEDNVYMSRDSSTRPGERWIWKRLIVFNGYPTDRLTTTFDLPHLVPQTSATVSSELGPEHAPLDRCYRARVHVNGQMEEKQWYAIHEAFGKELTVPSNDLSATGNEYTVEQIRCGDTSTLVFNAFTVKYQRYLVADNDTLAFENEGATDRNFRVSGFSSNDIVAFDTTNPDLPRRLLGGSISGNGPYTLVFGRPATGVPEEYLITTLGAARAVEGITPYTDQGLRDNRSQADYLVITHPDFTEALRPLIDLRRAQGLTVRVVETTSIYNDFGTGVVDPAAIRAFIRFAYLNWDPPAPAFVLLVGDGTYDPLDITGSGDGIWVPPMLVFKDEYLGEAPSDNAYVSGLDASDAPDDPLPDAHVGRLPANSPAEVSAMVQKLVTYETMVTGNSEWQRRILLTTDDAPDPAGDFYWLSDHLTSDAPGGMGLIPDGALLERIYLRHPAMNYPRETDARDAIAAGLNEGALLIQYIGHGSPVQWSGSGGIWSLVRPGGSDLAHLAPNTRLPMSLSWTCWDGYFVHPGQPAISESMMRLPERGFIAAFAPTGLDVATGHDFMAQAFYRALFGEVPDTQVGPLTTRAKLSLSLYSAYDRLIWTYMTYGDPATSLAVHPCLSEDGVACGYGRLFLPFMPR